MNLHLEIGTVPMHFLAMDTIKIRDADSAYKYAFTLIDMLTNYVFMIPVKDICGKTLVHEYIYKVYLLSSVVTNAQYQLKTFAEKH